MFERVLPTADDSALSLPGDDLVVGPTATIDSGFDLPGTPRDVFPWFVQLGKQRAGWYLPRSVERLVPPRRRALRVIDPRWQDLRVGDRIPDYGGEDGYFDCFHLDPDRAIGYTSQRGRTTMTWVLTFWPAGDHTRVVIRLRLRTAKGKPGPLMKLGELVDRLTILGLAAGLEERLREQPQAGD